MADQPGRCRVCGCTEFNACLVDGEPCGWADATRTLCNNPACVQHAEESARVARTLGHSIQVNPPR